MDEPTQIEDEEEYEEYLEIVRSYEGNEPDPDTSEGKKFNLLIRAITAYESEHHSLKEREFSYDYHLIEYLSTNYPDLHLNYRDGASIIVNIIDFVDSVQEVVGKEEPYEQIKNEDVFEQAEKTDDCQNIRWPTEPEVLLSTMDMRMFVDVPRIPNGVSSLEAAHRDCHNHREFIEASDKIGCFYCTSVLSAEVEEWIHDGKTALCPSCGIDAVLPGCFNKYTDNPFLEKMYARWFKGPHAVKDP